MSDSAATRPFATIPTVYGMSVEEAHKVLEQAGFTPAPQRFLNRDRATVVGSTYPPEGAATRIGARVDLLPDRAADADRAPSEADSLIDRGFMPDFSGWLAEDAVTVLAAHGYSPWPRETWSEHVDPGLVITSEPRANLPLQVQVVVLWVSTGPPVFDPPPPPPPPPETVPPFPI